MLLKMENKTEITPMDEPVIQQEDVEEGEISDPKAESSAADKQDLASSITTASSTHSAMTTTPVAESKPRVWTMKDLYKYQMGGGHVSGLHNLAWAQAVKNNPAKEVFVELEKEQQQQLRQQEENLRRSMRLGLLVNEAAVVSNDDVDKEEGELEEGEIDLDASGSGLGTASRDVELEKRVSLIRGELESLICQAQESFQEACSKLQNTMESLCDLLKGNDVSSQAALVGLSMNAIRNMNLVFGSMNNKLREQNKETFSRFLSILDNHCRDVFSPDQMKEIEGMIFSLDAPAALSSARSNENDTDTQAFGTINVKCDSSMATGAYTNNDTFLGNKSNISIDVTKLGVSGLKIRGGSLPLLDLHKDHDADNLPSPTQETAPPLREPGELNVGDGLVSSGLPMSKVDHVNANVRVHPYETDAHKAVSSYQQKFGRNSLFMCDRLPSPTPSDESSDGDSGIGGEISSSPTDSIQVPVYPSPLSHSVASPSAPFFGSSSKPGSVTARNDTTLSSNPKLTLNSSAKSRDPRLRYFNSAASAVVHSHTDIPKVEQVDGTLSSRKQKANQDADLVGSSLKRQKNILQVSEMLKDLKAVSRTGVWLEDSDMVGQQATSRGVLAVNAESEFRRMNNGATYPTDGHSNPNISAHDMERSSISGTGTRGGSEQASVTNIVMTALPDVVKDIAVNPTILINILEMDQLRSASDPKHRPGDPRKGSPCPPGSNSVTGVVPVTDVNSGFPQSEVLTRPQGSLQLASQMTSDGLGKIRMKPRDPRRVLHNNALQSTGSLQSEKLKINGAPILTVQLTEDNQNAQSSGHTETKSVPSLSSDMSMHFTKSLKNIGDVVSISQASATPNTSNRVDTKAGNANSEQLAGNSALPEAGAIVAHPRSHNGWSDIEHLFEGYDEKQKAAIQKERARRLEEQKRMFAARKLCLVLDLDHTLLNSAKFVDVDPMHDEILRKREQEDCEKQQRHLFRFPQMGMWTKLRPGIWNFLEKASKLYELHLYTMGNKLYATEMAKLLDPKGVLFNGRVISRGDDGATVDSDDRVPKSKDLAGVLGMESAVVIIDDSIRVWPHHKLNLIVVERYIYFPCSRRQFGLAGPSLLEIDHDERPEDGTLACSLAVIEKIHRNFFTQQSIEEADVRNILASEQRKILSGCCIVFSRVFPVGEANPHLHPLWQTAEQFGAVCMNQIDDKVTHVVASSLGTDKVNWAISTGRYVVHPGWVEASALLYKRANEQDFAIKL